MKMTFEDWMKQVDKEVNKLCGMSYLDLPDCAYSQWHEDGVKPASAAKRAMRGMME